MRPAAQAAVLTPVAGARSHFRRHRTADCEAWRSGPLLGRIHLPRGLIKACAAPASRSAPPSVAEGIASATTAHATTPSTTTEASIPEVIAVELTTMRRTINALQQALERL